MVVRWQEFEFIKTEAAGLDISHPQNRNTGNARAGLRGRAIPGEVTSLFDGCPAPTRRQLRQSARLRRRRLLVLSQPSLRRFLPRRGVLGELRFLPLAP